MALNKVMLIGNLGKDPEVRHLESGAVTASFTIATTERYKDKNGEQKEITEWHNIVCWRGLAEIAEKYLRKGSQIYVEGRIRTRSYQDKEGATRYITEIQADSFQMLGRKSENSEPREYIPQNNYTPTQGPAAPAAPATVATNPTQAAVATPAHEGSFDEGDDLPF